MYLNFKKYLDIPSDIWLCMPQPQTLEKERAEESKPVLFWRDGVWLLKLRNGRFKVEIFLRKTLHKFRLGNSLLNTFKLAIHEKFSTKELPNLETFNFFTKFLENFKSSRRSPQDSRGILHRPPRCCFNLCLFSNIIILFSYKYSTGNNNPNIDPPGVSR
jgi:hypothetical protein